MTPAAKPQQCPMSRLGCQYWERLELKPKKSPNKLSQPTESSFTPHIESSKLMPSKQRNRHFIKRYRLNNYSNMPYGSPDILQLSEI
jgi:hypothetical protein